MADEIDSANDIAQAERDRAIAEAVAKASNIPLGVAGDCDFCGEWSGRLVGGACAPCRDLRGLP
jgi:hypothetical protein